MGILLMNIVGFGLIEAAYFNPLAQGGAAGIDLTVYLTNFILFDGKMRGLFSFLFGASMLLVIERAEAKGESAARVHYLRMMWLLVFGLIHLYLIWWGDILSHYALVGMVAFLFRGQRTRTLVIVGIILVLVHTLLMLGLPLGIHAAQLALSDPAQAAQAQAALGNFARSFGVPLADVIAAETARHTGSYADVVAARLDRYLWTPLSSLMFMGLETLAYMLFGMAAFRSGLLTGTWPRASYLKWIAIGFGIGLPVYTALGWYLVAQDFSMTSVTLAVLALPAPVRPLMIVGWACLIVLLARPGGALTDRIAATGRMAFTNYLLTSLICTSLFYGYGAGLFGELSRAELYLVVLVIWAGMLAWSKPWLDRFAYGPLEWLWRSLARGSVQPLRRHG